MRKIIQIPLIVVGTVLVCCGGFAAWMKFQMRDMKLFETQMLSDSIFVLKGDASNMYLLKKGDDYIAFDASSNLEKLRAACAKLSIDPSKVKAVFLTHSDNDHAGGVSLFPSATIYLSENEVPLLKEKKYRHFMGLEHMNKLDAPTYKTLSDNDTLMIGDLGITAIATPGHTRGSMCYKAGRSLFTGDLCMLKKGAVMPMIGIYTENMKEDSESIRKIMALEGIDALYTAHAGSSTDPKSAFTNWKR